jgi:hypothetical protein
MDELMARNPQPTVIIHNFFDIAHNLSISPLGHSGHLVYIVALWLEDCGWLRMKNKRNCEQALHAALIRK